MINKISKSSPQKVKSSNLERNIVHLILKLLLALGGFSPWPSESATFKPKIMCGRSPFSFLFLPFSPSLPFPYSFPFLLVTSPSPFRSLLLPWKLGPGCYPLENFWNSTSVAVDEFQRILRCVKSLFCQRFRLKKIENCLFSTLYY